MQNDPWLNRGQRSQESEPHDPERFIDPTEPSSEPVGKGAIGTDGEPTPLDICPECGIDLATTNRDKEAIKHYGSEPLALRPDTRLARQRQAHIRGEPIPER